MPNISTVERGDWSRVEFLSPQPWIDVCLSNPQAGLRCPLSYAGPPRRCLPFANEAKARCADIWPSWYELREKTLQVEGRVPKTANEVPEAVGAQGILAQVDGSGIGIRAVAPESFWLWDAGLALC